MQCVTSSYVMNLFCVFWNKVHLSAISAAKLHSSKTYRPRTALQLSDIFLRSPRHCSKAPQIRFNYHKWNSNQFQTRLRQIKRHFMTRTENVFNQMISFQLICCEWRVTKWHQITFILGNKTEFLAFFGHLRLAPPKSFYLQNQTDIFWAFGPNFKEKILNFLA